MSSNRVYPPQVNIVIATLARLIFRLFGWRAEGQMPDLPRFVIVAAPHTSNWDGVIVIGMALVFRVRMHWLGKHTLFRPPFGFILRWLGGVPVDRTASHNAVQQVVQEFKSRQRLALVIAPEGTRRKTVHWKTGFYYIAQGADVPMVLGFIDYRRKTAGFGPMIAPSGDIEADVAQMRAFYAGITGRHPHKMSEITLGR